jgi:pimeloyl-ACP methyl ester carboxylesterase
VVRKDPFKPQFTKEFLKTFLFGEDCPSGLLDKAKEVFDSVPPEILEFRWNLAMKTETRRQLASSKKPILFMAGNQDSLLHEKHLADLALMQPNMEVLRLEAPHALLQRNPREAAAYVDAFVSQKLAVR